MSRAILRTTFVEIQSPHTQSRSRQEIFFILDAVSLKISICLILGIFHRLESCFWQSLRNDEFDGFDTSNESMSFLVIIVLFVGLVGFNTCVTFCVYVC